MSSFCGIYVHGYPRPFSFQENRHALLPFRELSSECHPLYIFYAKSGDIQDAVRELKNVHPIQISVMRSIRDYDRFMTRECFHLVKHENTLTMHHDGWLLKAGWEDYAANFDYIGASWHRHIPDFDAHYKQNPYAKFAGYKSVTANTTVGNGGFCFRKRSKILEVERSINWATQVGDWLPDDVCFSFWGFGQGIFRPVTPGEADAWSEEPRRAGASFGFHGLGRYIE